MLAERKAAHCLVYEGGLLQSELATHTHMLAGLTSIKPVGLMDRDIWVSWLQIKKRFIQLKAHFTWKL